MSQRSQVQPSATASLLSVTLYAAYGTNLDPGRMGALCPHSPLHATGWLQGWRLTFGGEEHGWDGSLATIVEDPFEQVFVAVYDVTTRRRVPDWTAGRSPTRGSTARPRCGSRR